MSICNSENKKKVQILLSAVILWRKWFMCCICCNYLVYYPPRHIARNCACAIKKEVILSLHNIFFTKYNRIFRQIEQSYMTFSLVKHSSHFHTVTFHFLTRDWLVNSSFQLAQVILCQLFLSMHHNIVRDKPTTTIIRKRNFPFFL